MKLVSNVAVSYSTGTLDGTMASGIIEGELRYIKELPDGTKIANYVYTVDGEEIKDGTYRVEAADVQAMYDAIKAGLPADTDINVRDWTKYYEGFKTIAADTFGVATSVFDIVA